MNENAFDPDILNSMFKELLVSAPEPPSPWYAARQKTEAEEPNFVESLGFSNVEAAYIALENESIWTTDERELISGVADGIVSDRESLLLFDALIREFFSGARDKAATTTKPKSKRKAPEEGLSLDSLQKMEALEPRQPVIREPEVQALPPTSSSKTDDWWEK